MGSEITSGTASQGTSELQHAQRATGSQTAPAIALSIALLAAQCAGMAVVAASTSSYEGPVSTQHLTTLADRNLLEELINFHERLASSQKDLPEEAARVLRQNLWHLYD